MSTAGLDTYVTTAMMMDPDEGEFHLLIADDSSAFRETLREFLQRRTQLVIHEVCSGEDALDYVQECRIDIVLLDMHMHRMTGLETLRMLKDLNTLRPCILITSDDSSDLRRDATEADAHAVLCKPMNRLELVTTLSSALHDAYDLPLSDDFG